MYLFGQTLAIRPVLIDLLLVLGYFDVEIFVELVLIMNVGVLVEVDVVFEEVLGPAAMLG